MTASNELDQIPDKALTAAADLRCRLGTCAGHLAILERMLGRIPDSPGGVPPDARHPAEIRGALVPRIAAATPRGSLIFLAAGVAAVTPVMRPIECRIDRVGSSCWWHPKHAVPGAAIPRPRTGGSVTRTPSTHSPTRVTPASPGCRRSPRLESVAGSDLTARF